MKDGINIPENRQEDPLTGKHILMEYTPSEETERRRFFRATRRTNANRSHTRKPKHKVDIVKTFDTSFL